MPNRLPRLAHLPFGPFELDLTQGLLRHHGQPVHLPPQPFSLLCRLAQEPGRVVSKDELLQAVWGHLEVSEASLKAAVSLLRRTLLRLDPGQDWVQSVPRRGYRFVAEPLASLPLEAPPDTDLIGREQDLAHVVQELMSAHLVTLIGPAGIGKTRLALAALPGLQRLCPEGAVLLRLEHLPGSAQEPALAGLLRRHIAQALGLPEEAARSEAALARVLRQRRLGLVLDNCEHLVDTLAPLLAGLLPQAPGLRLICTSQRALDVVGERLIALRPLALPAAGARPNPAQLEDFAACALFLRRCRHQQPDFICPPEQTGAVVDICRALDGMPLELELAAARAALLGLPALQRHLDQRLQWLQAQAAGRPTRHASLEAAIHWSYALLEPDAQWLLRQVALFEDSFSADQVQALATLLRPEADAWQALGALQQLQARSLITAAGAGEPRWRLLQSVRAFARRELQAAGEQPAAARALVTLTLQRQRAWAASAHDQPIRTWVDAQLHEAPQLPAALGLALDGPPASAWALWSHATQFWVRAGMPHEPLYWRERLLERGPPPEAQQADAAQALAVMGLYNLPVAPDEAEAAAEAAARGHAASGDTLAQYFDLYVLGQLRLRRHRSVHERGLVAAMRALEQPDWPLMRCRYRRLLHAYDLAQQQRNVEFHRCVQDELAIATQIGNRDYLWTTRHALGQALFARGDRMAATEGFSQLWDEIQRAQAGHLYWSTRALATLLCARRDAASAAAPGLAESLRALHRDDRLGLVASALPWLAWWRGQAELAGRLRRWVAQREAEGLHHGPIAQSLLDDLDAVLPAGATDLDDTPLDEAQALALALHGHSVPVTAPMPGGGDITVSSPLRDDAATPAS